MKAVVSKQAVRLFLRRHYNPSIDKVVPLEGGELSQAFVFQSNDQDLVIRINTTDQTFLRDQFAVDCFRSTNVPVPKILEIGRFSPQYYYAISERVEGKPLDRYPLEVLEPLIPPLMNILDEIHLRTLSGKSGYGGINARGEGEFATWTAYITTELDSLLSKLHPDDKGSLAEAIATLPELIPYCSEARCMLHGDFSLDNLISDGQTITGVIDWGNCKYGDWVFDVAWMDFWTPAFEFGHKYAKRLPDLRLHTTHFTQRLLCYRIIIALRAINFFRQKGSPDSVTWVRNRLGDISVFPLR